uniref:Uncharacterized protein n=1 Tax=Caenorhabditis tropicalis TaxID=1561998 RepID=A0A1I7TZA1_9PELO
MCLRIEAETARFFEELNEDEKMERLQNENKLRLLEERMRRADAAREAIAKKIEELKRTNQERKAEKEKGERKNNESDKKNQDRNNK